MWVERFGLRSNLLVGICLGTWAQVVAWCLVLGGRGPWDKRKKRGSCLALVC